jgi:hypothetical protein
VASRNSPGRISEKERKRKKEFNGGYIFGKAIFFVVSLQKSNFWGNSNKFIIPGFTTSAKQRTSAYEKIDV